MSVSSWYTSVSKRSMVGMNSIATAGLDRSTEHSSISSAVEAWRDGTASPAASLCVLAHDELKPSPPAAMESASIRFMACSSSGVASCPTERSPITTRRRALWPTRNPALGMSVPSMESRYSPKLRQSHGTPSCSEASGMPSTRASIRIR